MQQSNDSNMASFAFPRSTIQTVLEMQVAVSYGVQAIKFIDKLTPANKSSYNAQKWKQH